MSGLELLPSVNPVLESPLRPVGAKMKSDPAAGNGFADLLALLLGFNVSAMPAPVLQGGPAAGSEVKGAGEVPGTGSGRGGGIVHFPVLEQTSQGITVNEQGQPLPLNLPGDKAAAGTLPNMSAVAEGESRPQNEEKTSPTPALLSEAEGDKELAEASAFLIGNKGPELPEARKLTARPSGEGPPAAKAELQPGKAGDPPSDQKMPPAEKGEGEYLLGLNRLSSRDNSVSFGYPERVRQPEEKGDMLWQDFLPARFGPGAGEKAHQLEASAVPLKEVPSVFQRLVREARLLEGHGRQEITLQLEPEKLGRVHLTVLHQGGAVSARFEVENALARDALQAGLVELRQDLTAHGLRVEELQVLVGQNGAGTGSGLGGQDTASSFGWPSGNRVIVPAGSLKDQTVSETLLVASGLDLRV